MIKNKYKVNQKLWKSFGNAKAIFNIVYGNCIQSQRFMKHPNQKDLPLEQWKTLSWNFACEAAWAAKAQIK